MAKFPTERCAPDDSYRFSFPTGLGLEQFLAGSNQLYEAQAKVLMDEPTYVRVREALREKFGKPKLGWLVQTRYRNSGGGHGDLRLRMHYHIDHAGQSTKEGEPVPDHAEIVYREDVPGVGVAAKQRLEAIKEIDLETYSLLTRAFTMLGVYHDPVWGKFKLDYTVRIPLICPPQGDIDRSSGFEIVQPFEPQGGVDFESLKDQGVEPNTFGGHHTGMVQAPRDAVRRFLAQQKPEVKYRLSLQQLAGQKTFLGYVLEGSVKLEGPDTDQTHYNAIVGLFSQLGVEPTPSTAFMARVNEFIRENQDPLTISTNPARAETSALETLASLPHHVSNHKLARFSRGQITPGSFQKYLNTKKDHIPGCKECQARLKRFKVDTKQYIK